jgi:hypothetical protein
MKQIPGCSGITTDSGGSWDDNTISEGNCYLANATEVSVYVWAPGDITDQHDYVYQYDSNCGGPAFNVTDGCFVGSNPQPWFIDIATSNFAAMSAAESAWLPVENGLNAIHVSQAPASWCSTLCPYPGEPSGGGGFGGFG